MLSESQKQYIKELVEILAENLSYHQLQNFRDRLAEAIREKETRILNED